MTLAAQQISAAYPKAAPIAEDIVQVALAVGAHPYDLANLIRFESGGTFSPSIQNAKGATGLIQFYPGHTKKTLGVTTDALARLSGSDQMQWVRKYLDIKRQGRKLDTLQKLYMAVFYPAAMRWDPEDTFPQKVIDNQKPTVIETPADYIRVANRYARLPTSETAPPASELVSSSTAPETPTSSWGFPSIPSLTDIQRLLGPRQALSSWQNLSGRNVLLVDGNNVVHRPGSVPAGTYRVLVTEGYNADGSPRGRYLQSSVVAAAGETHALTAVDNRWRWN